MDQSETKPKTTKSTKPATAPAAPAAPATVIVGMATLPVFQSARQNNSPYDFDALTEVGMCIGVSGKSARQLSNMVSKNNRRFKAVGPDGVETVLRKFKAVDVTPEIAVTLKDTPLAGSTCLIQRIA